MNRIQALCAILQTEAADAMLLQGEVNLIYATSMTALEGCCLLFADETACFLTDGRYIEVAQETLTPQGFEVLLRPNDQPAHEVLQALLTAHGVQSLLYEDDVLTVRQFTKLRKTYEGIELRPIRDGITQLRACKSAAEIACIEQAQRIAEDAFAALLPELKAGITEKQAAARLDYLMAVRGSEKPSFDTILLFGEHTSMPHGVPSDRVLRAGDFITADFGAVCHGYHSDMTRTLAYGYATDEMQTVYETVLQAQAAAYAQAKAGNPCSAMHAAAADVIAKAGYGAYFTHALGHSVGLEIHEAPVAALRCDLPLQDGVVMTNEPGIYLAGRFGVRIEDMLVIAGDTARNLTKFPKAMQILS